MEPTDVAAALEPCALRLKHVVELPPYHYGAILRRADAG